MWADEDEDWVDTSVSACVEVPVFKEDVISWNGRTVGVSGLSLPVCNLRFWSGASNTVEMAEDVVYIYVSLSDQMRKECWERYGSTQSGKCTTCGKHIQMNLGKHVALYHMELAQLSRCPVSWCTVWKGTAQNCVDHMRRAHDIPPLVKVANLARWFPPWTVTREQWHSMS